MTLIFDIAFLQIHMIIVPDAISTKYAQNDACILQKLLVQFVKYIEHKNV